MIKNNLLDSNFLFIESYINLSDASVFKGK